MKANTIDLVESIRDRVHDAPLPTERLLDEAADTIERLRAELALHNCGDPACACIKDTPLGRERAMDELIAGDADLIAAAEGGE